MPRAHRHFLPGHVWHLTHRYHQRKFLLKFAHDRRRYLRWVFEAKKRFGLSVLNYMVTSNHIHLLVKDTGQNVIAQSMQLIAGRTAMREDRWSEGIAVGSLAFVDRVKSELGFKAAHREVAEITGTYTLREPSEAYAGQYAGENDVLMPENTIPWEENAKNTET